MRADRLISLMLLLYARGRLTAQTLAEQLHVSERTIYRDVEALCQAGVPIGVQPGVNGGFFLDEHYRVSLTGFNRAEVQALFVASPGRALSDLGLKQDATLLKLFAALPSIHQTEVERLRSRFHIDPANWFQKPEPSPLLTCLQQAVWEDRAVQITYADINSRPFEGVVNAYALVAKANVWYLVGEKAPGEFRHYRLKRMTQAALTETRFARLPNFDLAAYWEASCQNFERLTRDQQAYYTVVARIRPRVLRYLQDHLDDRYTVIEEVDAEGWTVVRVTFDSFEEAQRQMLGFGADIYVIEPETLRTSLADMALKLLSAYGVEAKPAL